VILTALQVEYEAVKTYLVGLAELVIEGTVYEVGQFRGEAESWTVALAQVGTGNVSASLETDRAIRHFAPNAVLFVGVGGGLKDVGLGDVVAADAVYGYEAAKAGLRVSSRMKSERAAYELVQRARAVSRDTGWLSRIHQPTGSRPQAFVGPIAAGEKVLAHRRASLHRFLQEHCGDALAVEMEGAGFLYGAWVNSSTPAIVIRGISDLIEGKTASADSFWQPQAARHASAFAFELLDRLGQRDPPTARRLQSTVGPDVLRDHWRALSSRYSAWGDDQYIALTVHPVSASAFRGMDLVQAVEASRRVLLIGPSGAGKSTALERLAWLELAKHTAGSSRMPVVVPLLRYTGDLRATIRAAMNSLGALALRTEDLETVLDQGSLLLMFDGLNEVPGSRRDVIVADIVSLMDTFPQHQYVITCRTEDPLWETVPGSALDAAFVLEPVSMHSAVTYLCHHVGDWLGRFAFGEVPPKLRELLTSPLLLWMFKEQVASARMELRKARILISEANLRTTQLTPRNRAQMYHSFVHFMLSRENQKGTVAAATEPPFKHRLLAGLALDMQVEHVLTRPRKSVAHWIRELLEEEGREGTPASLLREFRLNGMLLGDDTLRFVHQSFQEFFAAVPLTDQPSNVIQHADDPWWAETIVFLAGLLTAERLAPFVQELADIDVGLAFRCATASDTAVIEARRVVRDRLRLLLDDSNWVYRRQAIELLGLLEDESVVPDLANMLEDPNEEVRWQAASSLRAFSAQAIVPSLLRALRDPAWAVRARAAEALGHMRALDALPSLRPLFISSMPRERADATYALILMEVERGSTMLLPLLDDPDERVSDSARLAIEVLESEDKTAMLRQQLRSPHPNRREKAAYLVSRLELVEGIEDLARLLEDDLDDVVIVAMQSLAELHAVEYFPSILERLRHQTPFVRTIAAVCCQLFGFTSAAPALIPLLRDPDGEVRYATVRTLGTLGAADAVPQILPLLRDPWEKVRMQAAFALGALGDDQALSHLEAVRNDVSLDVRTAAAAATSQITRRQTFSKTVIETSVPRMMTGPLGAG
jgi:HEAT repeat protein/nucleoside phosphorylase